ncbi:hypothetical protein TNCV_1616621 [Trichonephila clavipes]|nr:hypothetical protein TNCV_1616621 [Trichonephila clavipes]
MSLNLCRFHMSQNLCRLNLADSTCPRTTCADSTCADSTCADSTCPTITCATCADSSRADSRARHAHGCCFIRPAHVVRICGPPAQELQLLHTVPSIFDGDLISFLDEFERELAIKPMDLTMPRLNPCVKKSIGFKAFQPMDLLCQ